jgi:hypothetical protein
VRIGADDRTGAGSRTMAGAAVGAGATTGAGTAMSAVAGATPGAGAGEIVGAALAVVGRANRSEMSTAAACCTGGAMAVMLRPGACPATPVGCDDVPLKIMVTDRSSDGCTRPGNSRRKRAVPALRATRHVQYLTRAYSGWDRSCPGDPAPSPEPRPLCSAIGESVGQIMANARSSRGTAALRVTHGASAGARCGCMPCAGQTGSAVVCFTRSSTKLVLQSCTLGCLSNVSMTKCE